MIGFDALQTNTLLMTPTEQLQELLVAPTHPALQHGNRLNQCVILQHPSSQVRLQVGLAIRRQTHQAGPQGLGLLSHAHVTANSLPHHTVLPTGSDLLRHFFGERVFAELRTDFVHCVTLGTVDRASSIPVRGDAGVAEAVATGDGDWLQKNILTDGALKLLFRQKKVMGSHHLRREKQNHDVN